MKYINKKLPLLKVGEEFKYMNQDVGGIHCFESNSLFCNESTLKTLISEGWIEEVKPREFWIEIQTTGTFVQTCKDDLDNEGEVIKVREVIG